MLPIANPIPEKLINFRVYTDGNDLIGAADVELPDLEYITETISGAGVAGEVDSPVIGHFKSMSLKLKWRTFNAGAVKLMGAKAHPLDLRGSIQRYDAGSGEYAAMPMKVVMRGMPKKAGLGKFEMGKPMDNESEFEVVYLKVWLDGTEVLEIDKMNFICRINGTDALADVRKHLGLES